MICVQQVFHVFLKVMVKIGHYVHNLILSCWTSSRKIRKNKVWNVTQDEIEGSDEVMRD